jgi:hypothetical protein
VRVFPGGVERGIYPAVSTESAKVRVAQLQKQPARVGERYEADEITREEWTQQGATLRGEIARLEAESAAPVDPLELLRLGQQWDSGAVTQQAAVLNALWQRIEVRADEMAANGRGDRQGDPARRPRGQRSRAGRGCQAVREQRPGCPNDGGPGASLNTGGRGWMGIEPTQDASTAPRKRF